LSVNAHTHTHKHTHALSLTHTHTHTHTHTNTHTHSHTHTQTHTHTLTHTHTHTHTLSLSHTHTQTHTHTLVPSLSFTHFTDQQPTFHCALCTVRRVLFPTLSTVNLDQINTHVFDMCVKSAFFKLMCRVLWSVVDSNASVQVKVNYTHNSTMSQNDMKIKRLVRLKAVMMIYTISDKTVSHRSAPCA
jgi:hypothetical protein